MEGNQTILSKLVDLDIFHRQVFWGHDSRRSCFGHSGILLDQFVHRRTNASGRDCGFRVLAMSGVAEDPCLFQPAMSHRYHRLRA